MLQRSWSTAYDKAVNIDHFSKFFLWAHSTINWSLKYPALKLFDTATAREQAYYWHSQFGHKISKQRRMPCRKLHHFIANLWVCQSKIDQLLVVAYLIWDSYDKIGWLASVVLEHSDVSNDFAASTRSKLTQPLLASLPDHVPSFPRKYVWDNDNILTLLLKSFKYCRIVLC